ncbi:Fungal specific transcription factor domain containing protein [Amanita muscaria]
MLLALCAYCAHLSPLADEDGEDGRAAANLWYQQARYGVRVCIKKGSSVEVAQALLLLAMTDYGQGNESQAWFLTGLAIRVGQDMDLNGDSPSTYGQKNLPPPEIRLRRNIWRVSFMLDLFLSLHLGRAPALFDGLRSATKYNVQQSEYATHPVPTFLHTVALCQTISRIYLHLYLAFNTPGLQTPAEKLTVLREELESWHRSLPAHYCVAVGNQSEKLDVLELNMLYQVAVILLHHPL